MYFSYLIDVAWCRNSHVIRQSSASTNAEIKYTAYAAQRRSRGSHNSFYYYGNLK